MKAYIRYARRFTPSPITPWIQTERLAATRLQDSGRTLRGFPRYYVEIDGFTFRFASPTEIAYCIQVLSRKNLPHWESSLNSHWLSRLPGWVKEWRYRQKAVKGLTAAMKQLIEPSQDEDARRDSFEQRQEQYRRRGEFESIQDEKKRRKYRGRDLQSLSRSPRDRRLRREALARQLKPSSPDMNIADSNRAI